MQLFNTIPEVKESIMGSLSANPLISNLKAVLNGLVSSNPMTSDNLAFHITEIFNVLNKKSKQPFHLEDQMDVGEFLKKCMSALKESGDSTAAKAVECSDFSLKGMVRETIAPGQQRGPWHLLGRSGLTYWI
jgi:hypothetical protein